MNKQELATIISKKTGTEEKNAYTFIGAFTDAVEEALINGDKVQLVGFGSFEIRERAARTGHNPQTGAAVQIPAKTVPVFKPGRVLREKINK